MYEQPVMNKATKNIMQKTKLEKTLNPRKKSLAEFCIRLIAMHFGVLGEQEP